MPSSSFTRIRYGIGLLLPLLAAAAVSAHERAEAPASIPAKLIADPRSTIAVVAPEDGRLVAPAGGFPVAGQRVHAGQLLAMLQPSFTQSERRDLGVELATQQRDEHINKLQMDRYQVDGTRPFDIKLPTPTVQLVADYRSAHAQATQLQKALQGVVPVLATADGVVLRAPARAGRTLVTGETLFELRSSGGLAVVADNVGEEVDAAAHTTATTLTDSPLRLRFISRSYDAALRTQRALYAVDAPPADVQVGEPVRLLLQGDAAVAAR